MNRIFLVLILACFSIDMTAKKKNRLFFDSKSNIVGISGAFEEISSEGFTAHFFENKVELPEEAIRKSGGAFDRYMLEKAFKRGNTGKKVLDYLFEYDHYRLSENLLKERAWQNVQRADEEKAEVGVIDKESILREDYLPILKNNFIYLQREYNGKIYWILFKVMITEETLNSVFMNWKDLQAYEKIKVEVKYVDKGKFKVKPYNESIRNKHIREISKKVPEFAIRGQVTSRSPFLAAMGSGNGVKSKDRVFVYSQHADKKGNLYSRKKATARVGRANSDQSYLYTISGGQASYKRGDVAVLRTDKNYAISVTGNYLDHSVGVNLTQEERLTFSRYGWSSYLIFQLGGGTYDTFDKRYYAITTNENGTHLYEAPLILSGGFGFGGGYTFAHCAEVVPYFICKAEYMVMLHHRTEKDKANNLKIPSLSSLGMSIPLGLKFNVNLWYPLQLTFGAEYVININFGRTKDMVVEWLEQEDENGNRVESEYSDYHYIKRDFMEPNNYKRSGLNLFAGFRIHF